MTHGVSIDPLPIPAALTDAGGQDFVDMVALANTVERLAVGTDDLSQSPEELLPHWRDTEFNPQDAYVARLGGRIVGRGVVSYPIEEDSAVAYLQIDVLPEYRSRGIGRALLEVLESAAVNAGRTVLQGWAYHGMRPGTDPLVPPTGFGAVDRSRAEVRFALSAGYALEQVERVSALDLPVEPALLEERRAAAAARAEGYRVVTWAGVAPAEWTDDFLHMRRRMSTDVPAGGLDIDEEVWTPQRLARLHENVEKGGGRMLTAVAQHLASGNLVGYTDLIVPPNRARPAGQEDTLVLREHRGHRLGMLLKIENILQLQRLYPSVPRITTFNAEENRPMLDVNEAIGFRPFCYEGAWKKNTSS